MVRCGCGRGRRGALIWCVVILITCRPLVFVWRSTTSDSSIKQDRQEANLLNNSTKHSNVSADQKQEDDEQGEQQRPPQQLQPSPPPEERCAILLYGLPRNFKAFVLPSLIKNVIIPNAPYNCDYYMHYYILEQEQPGWAGNGGPVHVQDVFLLESAVRETAMDLEILPHLPNVAFVNNTDDEFRQRNKNLLHQIATARNKRGKLRYIPTFHPFTVPTIQNIVKMWYGQELVWNLTMHHASLLNVNYTRLAVLRNDVIFVTPIDIWKRGNGQKDQDNQYAVTPGFGKSPVNDRMFQGPHGAVKMWTTERYSRLNEHMKRVAGTKFDGLHSERFLLYTLFPAIRSAGYPIEVDHRVCFCRVRTDDTIMKNDCWPTFQKQDYEVIIQRNCTTAGKVFKCPAVSAMQAR